MTKVEEVHAKEVGMLEKLMQTGKLDRRLAYFLDLDNDNEMTREFSMKKAQNKLDLL